MDFEFQASSPPSSLLVSQLSCALKQRTELISRKAHPRIWRVNDHLNSKKQPESILKKRRARSRLYGILLIIMGCFLAVPGLTEPTTLLVPLVAGIIGILAGILTLSSCRAVKKSNRQFDKAAKQLLDNLASTQPTHAHFAQDGMILPGRQLVAYSKFDFGCETQDLLLLTWMDQVAVLQKKDLCTGNVAQLTAFLQEHIANFTVISSVSASPDRDMH